MKKKKAKKKLPGVEMALAVATKLGLRKHKGLRDVPAEAMTIEPAADPDHERDILNRALRNMPPMPADVLETFDHRRKAVGDTVFIPFIGSEREEAGLDVKTTAYSVEQYQKMQEAKGKTTCDRCLGWGFMGKRKCVKCKGLGRV